MGGAGARARGSPQADRLLAAAAVLAARQPHEDCSGARPRGEACAPAGADAASEVLNPRSSLRHVCFQCLCSCETPAPGHGSLHVMMASSGAHSGP